MLISSQILCDFIKAVGILSYAVRHRSKVLDKETALKFLQLGKEGEPSRLRK